jgi:hypothetical protein
MEQKLSIFQDFLATLPPAALEVLQLTYDSNVQLTNELEKRKADIKQLRKVSVCNLWQASTGSPWVPGTRPAT